MGKDKHSKKAKGGNVEGEGQNGIAAASSDNIEAPQSSHVAGMAEAEYVTVPENINLDSFDRNQIASYTNTQHAHCDNSNSMRLGPINLRLNEFMALIIIHYTEDVFFQNLVEALTRLQIKYIIATSVEDIREQPIIINQSSVMIIDCRSRLDFTKEQVGTPKVGSGHVMDKPKTFPVQKTPSDEEPNINWVQIIEVFKRHNTDEFKIIIAIASADIDTRESSILHQAGFLMILYDDMDASKIYADLLLIKHQAVRQSAASRFILGLQGGLDAMSEQLSITDSQWRVEKVNTSFEKAFGYQMADVEGKMANKAFIGGGERESPLRSISELTKMGKTWEGQQTIIKKTNETIKVRTKVAGVINMKGKVEKHVAIRFSHDRTKNSLDPGLSDDLDDPHGYRPLHSNMTDSQLASEYSTRMAAGLKEVLNTLREYQAKAPVQSKPMYNSAIEAIANASNGSGARGKKYESLAEIDSYDSSDEKLARRSGSSEKPRYPMKELQVGNKSRPEDSSFYSHETEAILAKCLTWDFNVIELQTKCTHPLTTTAMFLNNVFNICSHLRIHESMFRHFMVTLESYYHKENKYHNALHAADVMQATAYFLHIDQRKSEVFDANNVISALIAAAAHDVDHPGRANAYLINSYHHFAILYNDLSVLESHHASTLFDILRRFPETNIFCRISSVAYDEMRSQIIGLILATEMAKHFDHLNRFVSVVLKRQKKDKASQMRAMRRGNTPQESESTLEQGIPSGQVPIVLKIMLKCADVNNPTRPLELSKQWALRIAEEYYEETDEEKAKGMPIVLPIFDRHNCKLALTQKSFIEFFLIEMFTSFDEFWNVPQLMENLAKNYDYWCAQERIS